MIAVREERPVVGGKDDERPLIQTEPLEHRHKFSDRPIQLLDHVAVQPARRFPPKLGRGEDRHVRHDMRHIQEKRPLAILLDELDGVLGEAAGELRLVRVELGRFFAIDQRQRRNIADDRVQRAVVVAVGEAQELVEAVFRRQEGRAMPQMPFAENRRGITLRPADFRQ